MTPPRDALFVDALSGSDGTAEVAPPPWQDERFGDPLAASPAEPRAAAIPVVTLPVVELAPPDPREWMSHLAGEEPQSAPRRPGGAPSGVPGQAAGPMPAQYPGVQYAAQLGAPSYLPGSWAPPGTPGQRHAARQSSAPARRPAPQRPASTQRAASASRQATMPGQARPAGRKKSGGGWTVLFVLIIFLVFSGLGREAIDALLEILNR